MKSTLIATALLLPLLLVGCDAGNPAPPAPPPAPAEPAAPPPPPPPAPPAVPVTAHVTLAPTEGNSASGHLMLSATDAGVRISGAISGVEADGTHAFHIHETGDCSAPDATSAGPHFNPHAQPHGHPGEGEHHVGDMLNLVADADGVLQVDRVATGATLGDGGATDVLGRAIILHAAADDYQSQPAGDAGARIACGVIRQ